MLTRGGRRTGAKAACTVSYVGSRMGEGMNGRV